MNVSRLGGIITGAGNASGSIKNRYATSSMLDNAGSNIKDTFNDQIKGLKDSKFGKWVAKKLSAAVEFFHFDKIKDVKNNIVSHVKENIGKIKDSGIVGKIKTAYQKISENKTIKTVFDGIADKFHKIAENPNIKKCCEAVKKLFKSTPKTV